MHPHSKSHSDSNHQLPPFAYMSDTDSTSSGLPDEPAYTPFSIPSTNPTLNDFRKVIFHACHKFLLRLLEAHDEKLLQALDHAHEHTQGLLEHIKKLRSELSGAKLQLKSLKKTRGRTRKNKRADNLLNYDKITLLGKKYAIFVGPWCLPSYFMVPVPEGSPLPQSIERLESFNAYKMGGILELHEYLSGEKQLLEQAQEYAPFREAFIKEVNASRSTSVHNVQASAHIVFGSLNLPADLWARTAGSQRKESPEFRKLLLFPGEQHPKTLIPLYYADLKKDSNSLFKVDALTNVLRLVLWGKQSLTAARFTYEARLVGSKWGAEHVNNSMIAFAAIVAKYLISEDPEFVEEGTVSRIPYHLQFYKILRLLKRAENTEYYKELLAFWNQRVFRNRTATSTSISTAPGSDADDSDLNDMAEALQRIAISQPTLAPSTHMSAPGVAPSHVHFDTDSDLSDILDGGNSEIPTPADEDPDQPTDPAPAVVEPRNNRRGRGKGKGKSSSNSRMNAHGQHMNSADDIEGAATVPEADNLVQKVATRPKPRPRKQK
ncbi:hypothetical protein EV361DRAFT_944538 [Lentinula raphanica]|nr:hypothetical protein EV361DRAFT_944538 [Lentinula raphanica]